MLTLFLECLCFFRREQGYCSICFSADSADDISIGGFKNAAASKKGEVAVSFCRLQTKMAVYSNIISTFRVAFVVPMEQQELEEEAMVPMIV